MKKILLALLCITIACINIKAQQTPFLQWQKTYGGTNIDRGRCIRQTTDGGYILAGVTYSNNKDVSGNHGNSDYWIVKLNAAGNIQWQKTYGGSGYDEANSIQQTTDGGYIIAGTSSSNDGDITGNHGGYDYWIVKTDAFGNIQWQKAYGGSGADDARSIQQTADGGYIVAGNSGSNDGDVSGNYRGLNYWTIKLDPSGIIQWQKSLGGLGYEKLFRQSIQQTTDGGYIVGGYSYSKNGHTSRDADYWMVKLNAAGNVKWEERLGGSGQDMARSIQQTADEGYIIVGSSNSNDGDAIGNNGNQDYWVVKTDALGNIQWQKSLGGSRFERAMDVKQSADGGYIVVGKSQSTDGDIKSNNGVFDYWVIKIDAFGDIQWQKSLGGSAYDAAQSTQQTADGGYIILGNSSSNNGEVTGNHGNTDVWVVKLSPEFLGTNLKAVSNNRAELMVSPNPAKNYFVIHFKDDSQQQLNAILYDVNGKIVWSSGTRNAKALNGKQINTSQFAKGVYYLKLMNENGELTGSTKVVIAK